MAAYFAVGPTVTRADIPGLCAALAESLRGGGRGVVVCDVGGVTRPDVATVEALARLRMTARRHGRRLAVGGAGPELVRLIGLLGLFDLLVLAAHADQPDHADQNAQSERASQCQRAEQAEQDEQDEQAEGDEGIGLLLQAGRQPEQRKQAVGVEEVVDPGDPSR